MDYLQIISRLIISFLLGFLIGVERERKKKGAGLRTHILVSLSSCLIMLISIYLYLRYPQVTDPSRIASGVITGIGFLGAGTIIRTRENIRGLTTAASIWVSSAVGLACGCGYYFGAIVTTLITVLVLGVLKVFENFPNEN